MKKNSLLTLIVFFGFYFCICGSFSASASKENAVTLIEGLGSRAIHALTDSKIADAERESRFMEIFSDVFAVEAIAKFVLGRYRSGATPEEKRRFLEVFKQSVARTYAARFKNYNRESFKVGNAFPEEGGGYKVKSKILRPNGPPVEVEWKVYEDKEGNLKITDVVVERVSMSITQRSEYATIIQKNGGTVSDLNAVLADKLKA